MHQANVIEVVNEEQLQTVLGLRYEVYTAEMGLYRGSADSGLRRLPDEHDEGSRLFIGVSGGRAVGTVRLHVGPFPEGWARDLDLGAFRGVPHHKMAFGSRFTVLPEHRGTEVVLELVKACYRAALEEGCELLLLDCVPHLVNLYEGLGWRRYTRHTIEDPHTGVLIPMALATRDGAHLARVRSPFLALLDEMEPRLGPATIESARLFEREDLSVRRGSPAFASLCAALTGEGAAMEGLSPDDLAALLEKSQVLDLAPWQTFVREGTVYRTLFVVLSGEVEISKASVSVCALPAGQFVGEVSWLLGTERSADVSASGRGARVIALHEGTVKAALRRQPQIGLVLMSNLARTLAHRLAGSTWSAHAAGGAL